MKPTTPLGTQPFAKPKLSRQEIISQELQAVIDQIPADEEADLRKMLQEVLSPWEIWIEAESKNEMAREIVEKLFYRELLPAMTWQPPLEVSEDQSALATVSEWLLSLTP
jgi:hypothetical protein